MKPCHDLATVRWRDCYRCYKRRRYKERKKPGVPWWMAAEKRIGGWIANIESTKKWRKRNPELVRAQAVRHEAKMKRLYGARPWGNTEARARWLDAKEKARRDALAALPR